jgi:hypothetical protein
MAFDCRHFRFGKYPVAPFSQIERITPIQKTGGLHGGTTHYPITPLLQYSIPLLLYGGFMFDFLNLTIGSSGKIVEKLQGWLNELQKPKPPLSVNGFFDLNTANAVTKFP